MNMDRLKHELRGHEGFRQHVYDDADGQRAHGKGHVDGSPSKLTVAYGRNLEDVGIRHDEAELMLANDIRDAYNSALRYVDLRSLDEGREHVIINMAFNLGSRLGSFVNMLDAVRHGEWERAADEMLDSRWAEQVGSRAQELARRMREG
jgi:lysozyme